MGDIQKLMSLRPTKRSVQGEILLGKQNKFYACRPHSPPPNSLNNVTDTITGKRTIPQFASIYASVRAMKPSSISFTMVS